MDTTAPVPPLLVAEGDDLTFFRSQEALGGYLEPWFVEVEYRAWDGLGRRLELVVVEPRDAHLTGLRKLLHGEAPVIEARLGDPAAATSDECAAFLRQWLPKVGGPERAPGASLSDLLVQGLLHGDLR